jgi:peptidoglycan hydrolase-like protein with peptidoglycan-binding domain
VTAVQKILYAAYANFPTPTGYFGVKTQAALKQWQKEHGIEQTGTVGPKTGAAMKLCLANAGTSSAPTAPKPSLSSAITRTLSKGMSGPDVLTIQQFLISQALLSADSATGYFGALTEAAVKKFQMHSKIVSSGTPSTTGYGAVGPKTRAVIALLGGTNVMVTSGGGNAGSDSGTSGSVGGGITGRIPDSGMGFPVVLSPSPAPSPNQNPAPAGTPPCTLDSGLIDGCAIQ